MLTLIASPMQVLAKLILAAETLSPDDVLDILEIVKKLPDEASNFDPKWGSSPKALPFSFRGKAILKKLDAKYDMVFAKADDFADLIKQIDHLLDFSAKKNPEMKEMANGYHAKMPGLITYLDKVEEENKKEGYKLGDTLDELTKKMADIERVVRTMAPVTGTPAS